MTTENRVTNLAKTLNDVDKFIDALNGHEIGIGKLRLLGGPTETSRLRRVLADFLLIWGRANNRMGTKYRLVGPHQRSKNFQFNVTYGPHTLSYTIEYAPNGVSYVFSFDKTSFSYSTSLFYVNIYNPEYLNGYAKQSAKSVARATRLIGEMREAWRRRNIISEWMKHYDVSALFDRMTTVISNSIDQRKRRANEQRRPPSPPPRRASPSPPPRRSPSPQQLMAWERTLGVRRRNGAPAVRKAYLKLVLKHHPNKGGKANSFREIHDAWMTAQRNL